MKIRLIFIGLILWACALTAAAQDPSPAAYKLDEFGEIHYGDASARLDSLFISLQAKPDHTARVIVYAGEKDHPGISRRHANRMRNYLLFRKMDPKRVTAVDGGRRESFQTIIWMVPAGATPPEPTDMLPPDIYPADLSVKFDEYPVLFEKDDDHDMWDGRYEWKDARLDGVAAVLKEQPEMQLRVIGRARAEFLYRAVGKRLPGGKRKYVLYQSWKLSDPAGTDRKMAAEEKSYLVEQHGIDPARIQTIGEGYNKIDASREEITDEDLTYSRHGVGRSIELWLVPPGAPERIKKKSK